MTPNGITAEKFDIVSQLRACFPDQTMGIDTDFVEKYVAGEITVHHLITCLRPREMANSARQVIRNIQLKRLMESVDEGLRSGLMQDILSLDRSIMREERMFVSLSYEKAGIVPRTHFIFNAWATND